MGHVQVIMDEWTWYHYTRSVEHKTRGECMQTSKQSDLAIRHRTNNNKLENKRKDWLREAQGIDPAAVHLGRGVGVQRS